jgi:transcriptional regulator with XRE-family HTH domain
VWYTWSVNTEVFQPGFRASAIQELLDRDGLTMVQFARRARISKQLLHAWMTRRVSPHFATVLKLCQEFGVSADFFAEGIEPDDGVQER